MKSESLKVRNLELLWGQRRFVKIKKEEETLKIVYSWNYAGLKFNLVNFDAFIFCLFKKLFSFTYLPICFSFTNKEWGRRKLPLWELTTHSSRVNITNLGDCLPKQLPLSQFPSSRPHKVGKIEKNSLKALDMDDYLITLYEFFFFCSYLLPTKNSRR